MKVAQIMTQTVRTTTPDTKVFDVARLMTLNRISGVPVVEDDRLVGIVSEKDILRAIYPSYQEYLDSPATSRNFEEMEARYSDVKQMKVSQIMTKTVSTVSPDTPILKAASVMILKKVRRLPVVDDMKKVVGIVTQGDLHLAVFEKHLGL